MKIIQNIASAALVFAAATVHAAPVTLYGDTINYVYDDEQVAIDLFGDPDIIGDVVRFAPPAFRAESNDGEGTEIAAANFIFDRVYSVAGNEITNLQVIEFGDYKLVGGDSVEADLLLTVSNNISPLEYASSDDNFSAVGDSGGRQNWEMSTQLDPSEEFDAYASDVLLTIQNTLQATTDSFGEVAWIQKKLSFVAVSQVPLPAAAWLFGSAMLGLVTVARRKKA